MQSRDNALEYLFSRLNFERSAAPPYRSPAFRLQRMRDLLGQLADPHHGQRTIHLAGTKGKGSTGAMTSAILQAAGLCVGHYSSPHLVDLEERFQVDGKPCSAKELCELTASLQPVVKQMDQRAQREGGSGPTFFEITTAMAFLHFQRRGVDWVVLETGLGGRLDSTNVCQPALCILTSISLDHTRQLGDTLIRIAREKAGIIKPGVPVVSGVNESDPAEQIARAASSANTNLELLGRDFQMTVRFRVPDDPLSGLTCHYQDRDGGLENLHLPLNGVHQGLNAALAIRAVRWLRQRGSLEVQDKQIAKGLAHTVWPGRLECLGRRPCTILDVAHNEASIAALLRTIQPLLDRLSPRVLIFAASRDKDVANMLNQLLHRFDRVLLTRFANNPRAMTLEELHDAACESTGRQRGGNQLEGEPSLPWEAIESASEAWRRARQLAGPGGLVCITGSFFLAGQIREDVARSLRDE